MCAKEDLRPASSPTSGFGVTMVYAAHNLAKAFVSGRIHAPPRSSLLIWTSESFCGAERNHMCYWEPVTNCTVQLLAASGAPAALDAEREQAWAGIDGVMHDFAPPEYHEHGSFWFQARQFP